MSRLVEIGKLVAGKEASVSREPLGGVFLRVLALSSLLAMVSCASPFLEPEPTPLRPTGPSTPLPRNTNTLEPAPPSPTEASTPWPEETNTLEPTPSSPAVPSVAPARQALTLDNYPTLFEKEVMIVVGEDATPLEQEVSRALAERLSNLTGNDPTIKGEAQISEDDKGNHNLVVVGTPMSSRILEEVYRLTDATRVTTAYPGQNRGWLEILANPWNANRALLIVAGSDEWGVQAGAAALAQFQDLDGRAVSVEWEGTGQTPSPYASKIGATLDLLLTLRGTDEIPEDMREITQRDTVRVSINFSHELNASEIRSLEEQEVRFIRLDGEVAHSGTIYGADVPWDRIEDLTEVESVVRVESAWQPGLQSPAD